MDVAIVAAARFAISEPFAGGMEMHTHVLADALAGRGHKVTVYAAGGEGRFDVEPLLPVGFESSDVARRDVSAGPAVTLSEHHSYLDAVLRLTRAGHELVHLNAVHHLPFACSPLIPSVVTGTLHSPPTPWLESALVLAAQQANPPVLVSVSRANAAAWQGVGISHVIGNGVDLDAWRRGPGGPAAVWSGRVVPEKGPHLAIDAARLAGLPLRLVGPRHDDRYFADEIQPRLGDGIEYLGHLSSAEVADVVGRSCVAVVTPRWEEPFGLVVAEALACGTPVAGFARGALPELIDARTGVLVAPDDVGALAGAMVDAATLSREHCRSVATARFSSTVMVDAYESWFADLIDRARVIVPGTRVVQHPADHPYLRHLGLVPDRSASAPSVWNVDALAAAGVDVVHLHFGFEHLGADELARWVERLRLAGIALVHTVHDLDNPHLVDQREFHRAVGVLTAAAAAVLTLTDAAADRIAVRYGRSPTVVAHPHVVPLADMHGGARDERPRRGVYVHAATVRPNLDVALLLDLVPAARPVGGLRVHVRDSVPAPFRQWLQRTLGEAGATVEVDPRLSDEELWARLGDAALVALPYRWGTHSGLLEAARDLGTPTLAPAFGGYRDQGAHVFDGADLAGSVRRAVASPPVVDPDVRRNQRDAAAAVHAALYADLAGVRA